MRSQTFSFGGANIKGTPPMKASDVRNDVRKISAKVDVFVVQEFRHLWYWATIRSLLAFGWRSYPSFATGLAQPVFGGQAVFWKRKYFKKINEKILEAFDFALDNSGIMENRWIRAALLEDKKTQLLCWFMSTHFVVGADAPTDSDRRKHFMHQNLNRLDRMLTQLCRSDAPVIFQGDLNIHQGTWAYEELMLIINKYHGRIVGEKNGVEFLVVFDSHSPTKVVVEKDYVLTPKGAALKTDHEVRCMDFHLSR